MVDDVIRQEILAHSDAPVSDIMAIVRDKYGKRISPAAIVSVLNARKRAKNISDVQTRASENLSEKQDLTEDLITSYLRVMDDETLPIKDRLTAMRDLRHWVKMAVDFIGDGDTDTENLFVIGEDWDLGFGPDETG